MEQKVVILVAESNDDDFYLINKNLHRSGLNNEILRFVDSKALLDFLFARGNDQSRQKDTAYTLLLNIDLPVTNGLKVLQEIKADPEIRKMPVIILSSKDDFSLIKRCHDLGCSIYLTVSSDMDIFADSIRKIGSFLSVVEVPAVNW